MSRVPQMKKYTMKSRPYRLFPYLWYSCPLTERLKASYLADAALDQEMAEEWRPLEEETWMRYVVPYSRSGD